MSISSRLSASQSDHPGEGQPPKRPRLAGVDAARGIALIGMIAIHVFSLYDEQTDNVSWLAAVFSGRASALFAVMAGVGLAWSAEACTPIPEGMRQPAGAALRHGPRSSPSSV